MRTVRRQDLRLHGTTLAPTARELHPERHCSPHTWDCPVLMKLDPSAVAWTCAGCGAIVTAPVGAPRPQGSAVLTG